MSETARDFNNFHFPFNMNIYRNFLTREGAENYVHWCEDSKYDCSMLMYTHEMSTYVRWQELYENDGMREFHFLCALNESSYDTIKIE